jgi:Cyclic nucleotide-binding domain
MLKLVYAALNVRPEERTRALLLLGFGFFMGVFLATFQLTSETQLITQAGADENSANLIRQGLFAAALLGVVSTGLFAFFQNRISFGVFSIANLTFIFLVVVTFYVLFRVLPQEYIKTLSFIQFAFLGPVVAVFLLGFWGIFGRLFDLRQSKRIIGGIDTGQLLAAILTFFTIGLGASVAETYNLLLVSAISVIGAMVFLIIIVNKFKLGEVKAGYEQSRHVTFKEMIGSRYVVLLGLFISFSIFAYLLVENSYLSALSEQYPVTEEASLRQFLGWFSGSILILSFVFQTFFNDRVIAEYGLRVSLTILPVILGVIALLVIFVGSVTGQTAVTTAYFTFFLFVALAKLFITFLRDALESPAFKLYFMTLDNKIRFDIQAKIEGVVVEFAKVIAGGAIILLGLLSFFEIIHYYYILLFIVAGWIYLAGKLYAEYRNRIRAKLESQDIALEEMDIVQDALIANIQHNLQSEKPATAVFSFKLLEKINPVYVAPSINTLMKHDSEIVRDFAQHTMNVVRGVSVSDRYIISAASEEAKKGRILLTDQEIRSLLQTGEVSKKRLAKLCRSEDAQDRQYGAELIGNMESEDSLSFMLELLHDIDKNVRIAAITSAKKRHNLEILNGLVYNLKSAAYSNLAKSTLYVIGRKALPVLDNAFYKGGQDAQVMLRIVQIMGRIGGRLAMEMLWNKIDYPDKIISSQVLDSLSQTGFKATLGQITRIKYAIESNISDIAWNIAAYLEIPDNKNTKQLRVALKEENDHDIRYIYTLLSMLYDAKSIYLVKQNLESGTSEGITYAIELLDVLLAEDLKQKIIPILDDISDTEKVKKLQIFYPRAKLSTKIALKFLINRDFTQSNRWTKACSLYQIGRLKIAEFKYDLIANLFNPDMMVKQMAAWGLHNIDHEYYLENVARLDKDTKAGLDSLILNRREDFLQGDLIFEKVRFLKSMKVFKGITGLLLSYVADNMPTKQLTEGETLNLGGEMAQNFIIVRSGKANLYTNGELSKSLESKNFVGEQIDNQEDKSSGLIVALEDTNLLIINKDRYYELLSDNLLFAQSVIKYMTA